MINFTEASELYTEAATKANSIMLEAKKQRDVYEAIKNAVLLNLIYERIIKGANRNKDVDRLVEYFDSHREKLSDSAVKRAMEALDGVSA